MNPEEIFGKNYQEFEEVDPYNLQNLVKGFISHNSNEYYGTLIITHINNIEVTPQLIMGTPKMHYPFDSREDGTRNYKFPVVKDIEIYEKLDGTNILAYRYNDGIRDYFSYKTRLTPFVKSGRFGDFYSMWNEVASKYFDNIKKVMNYTNCNLSFELYGARNPHLLAYDNSLDFILLFAIGTDGHIFSPKRLNASQIIDFPNLFPMKIIDKDYVLNYEELQKELQDKLIKTEGDYYKGMEGTVWYLHTLNGRCIQLKCKPETIEAIHFSAGKGISKNVILATCWNALENTDNLTVDFIKQLLQEEFKPEVVEANHYLIESCIEIVTKEMIFKTEVLNKYKSTGKNILLEKREVMRELSQYFPKNKMKRVYSYIAGGS